jgi:mono/diheme cytochrome c family protein
MERQPTQYSRSKRVLAGTFLAVAGAVCAAAMAQAPSFDDIGRPATQEDIGILGIASGPSGKDLPPGSGTARDGAPIYLAKCAMCHGANLEGVTAPSGSFSTLHGNRLGGGNSVPFFQRSRSRVVTSSYYFAFVTSLWNTIAVEMPFFRAGTLTPDEVYALTAYILFKNDIIGEEEVMDRETLPKVEMPNRGAFVPYNVDDVLDIEKRDCRLPIGFCP